MSFLMIEFDEYGFSHKKVIFPILAWTSGSQINSAVKDENLAPISYTVPTLAVLNIISDLPECTGAFDPNMSGTSWLLVTSAKSCTS